MRETDGINTREYQESQFLSEIAKQEEYEKLKEIKWFVCKGDNPISETEAQGILYVI